MWGALYPEQLYSIALHAVIPRHFAAQNPNTRVIKSLKPTSVV